MSDSDYIPPARDPLLEAECELEEALWKLEDAQAEIKSLTKERDELAKAFIEVFDSTTSHRQATLYDLCEKLRKEASGE